MRGVALSWTMLYQLTGPTSTLVMVGKEGAAIGSLKGKALAGFKKDPSTSSAMACG